MDDSDSRALASPVSEPWYRDGLPFTCTRCGACCTGAPGYVWVDIEEVDRLAIHLKMTFDDFARKYLRIVGERLSLLEETNGDCVLWSPSVGCTVYESRPTQCRTWPFWPENLETPEEWKATQEACPGARSGRWHDLVEIQKLSNQTQARWEGEDFDGPEQEA